MLRGFIATSFCLCFHESRAVCGICAGDQDGSAAIRLQCGLSNLRGPDGRKRRRRGEFRLVLPARFYDLDIDLLVRLPGARAHLQPVTNFRLELSQCFAARGSCH